MVWAGMQNRWIYTEDSQIYYDLLGTYEFSGTPLAQVSDAPALFGVRPATWDNEYRCYTVANGAPYAVARSDGSMLSSFRYKNVCMAGDELIAVEDTDGNWGYCDINGEEVIPCTYQAAMQAEGASGTYRLPVPGYVRRGGCTGCRRRKNGAVHRWNGLHRGWPL